MGKQYGVLISWAPFDEYSGHRLVDGPYGTRREAVERASGYANAGAEYVILIRTTDQDPWTDPKTGLGVSETWRARWIP